MEYRRLGKSGLKISEVGLGSWLTYGGYVGQERAVECIHRAYDLGVNFFDTANAYGRGAAEEVLGKAIKSLPRTSLVVATKVFFPMGDGPNDRGLSRKHIVEQCDASLQRLGVDYIDLYQCHRHDDETPLDETLWALDHLVRQGKVLYYGVSEWTAAQITEAVHVTRAGHLYPLVSNQPYYSMLGRAIERDVMPVCDRYGIGQVVFSPLAQGVLTGKYRPGQAPPAGTRYADPNANRFFRQFLADDTLQRVQNLRPIAEELGLTMAQLALAWVLRQPGVASAIVGASRPEQVEDNAGASGVSLPDDVLVAIDDILAL